MIRFPRFQIRTLLIVVALAAIWMAVASASPELALRITVALPFLAWIARAAWQAFDRSRSIAPEARLRRIVIACIQSYVAFMLIYFLGACLIFMIFGPFD